ncbi:hypothetical protein JXO52_16230 [bacterium]|nr:hypothetical protein [bacterium]
MRPDRIPALLFCLLLSASAARAQTPGRESGLTFHVSQWDRTEAAHVWYLPHRFIMKGTELLYRNGTKLTAGDSYRLDYVNGVVLFDRPVPPADTVTISYRYLPLTLQTYYLLWNRSSAPDSAGVPSPGFREGGRAAGTNRFPETGALQRSGSIFRGISLGSDQGMRLQSGLRLQISGSIASGVDLVASLTDQSTPIQPEGNTQTLQEIDKIFISVSSPHFKATLGDFVVSMQNDAVGSYDRKLQGAMSEISDRGKSLKLIAAASKGTYKSMYFSGVEGKQGPYQLTGTAGQREIIVLAGTEKVFIDGQRLVRGEDNDYTIEYGSGQITFTRKKLITADSRITVDFEYSDQKFQKQVYGAEGSVPLFGGRLRVGGSLLYEADDRENPLDIVLSDTYRDVLNNAGDDPDAAVAPGAEYVGERQGSYTKKDSLGRTIYVYSGAGRGDHIVRFSYVGEGKGDYIFQGYGIYRFAGDGEGSYAPVIYLPVARSHQVAGLVSELDLSRHISLTGSWAVSTRDNNTYSDIGDGDNSGAEWQASLAIDRSPLRPFGKQAGVIDVSARLKRSGVRFVPLARVTPVEHGRKWGKDETDYQGESIQEVTGAWEPVEQVRLAGGWGGMDQADRFSSSRSSLSIDVNRPRLPRIEFLSESIGMENSGTGKGYWNRRNGAITVPLSILTASVLYQGEHQRQDLSDTTAAGFRFAEYTGKIALRRGMFLLSHARTHRVSDRYENSTVLNNESTAGTGQTSLTLAVSDAFSSSLLFTSRTRAYNAPDTENNRSALADLILRYGSPRRPLGVTGQYAFSSTQASEMVRDTIQVGQGLGNYRYDEVLGEIVPDSDGDLLIRSIQTGVFLPVNQLKFSLDCSFSGRRIGRNGETPLQRLVSRLQSQTVFRIERQDKENGFAGVNRHAFSTSGVRDSAVVSQLLSLRHYTEYTPENRDFSLRIEYKGDLSANHELLYAGLVRSYSEGAIRCKTALNSRFALEARAAGRSEEKDYDDQGRSDRDIDVLGGDLQVSYRPRRTLELTARTSVQRGADRTPDPDIAATALFIQSGISYEILEKGRLRADYELGKITSEETKSGLPYEMFRGDQPGTTQRWNIYLSYRINTHVMATLSYRGRNEPWRNAVFHAGQVEVRAFF